MEDGNTALKSAIQDLRSDIAAAKLELDAKERSLKVLEGIVAKVTVSALTPPSSSEPKSFVEDGGLIDLEEIAGGNEPKKRTLMHEIKDVVMRFGTQEFTIGHTEAVLKKLEIEIPGKTPRARISMNLAKLCDAKLLTKTFEGSGNTPNRYRLTSSMTAEELAGAPQQLKSPSVPDSESKDQEL